MSVYPGARYRPLNGFSTRGVKPRFGVALHVNDSDGPSLYNWIAGNNDMSCHFQVAKSGVVEQYIDTDNASWCQMDGNSTHISIETQGFPSEYFTSAQLTAIGKLMGWIHRTHGIPLVATNSIHVRGLVGHGAGGSAWGGHTGCPGTKRLGQRAAILKIAGAAPSPGPAPTGPHLRHAWPSWMPAGHYFGLLSGPNQSHGGANATERAAVKLIQERLQALGYAPKTSGWADGIFEGPTKTAVTNWQKKHMPGTSFYGQVWSDDWKKLFTY